MKQSPNNSLFAKYLVINNSSFIINFLNDIWQTYKEYIKMYIYS